METIWDRRQRKGAGQATALMDGAQSPNRYSQSIPDAVGLHRAKGFFHVASATLRYQTVRGPQFIDITEDVARVVALSGISEGVAVMYSRHTTAAIKINEHEPELLKDMEQFLAGLLPRNGDYRHNNFLVRVVNMEEDECPNAHAHCQHLLLSSSESIPLVDGRLQLGRWQRIFLVELDHGRLREVVVSTMGC